MKCWRIDYKSDPLIRESTNGCAKLRNYKLSHSITNGTESTKLPHSAPSKKHQVSCIKYQV